MDGNFIWWLYSLVVYIGMKFLGYMWIFFIHVDLDFTAMDNQPPIKPTFKTTILKLSKTWFSGHALDGHSCEAIYEKTWKFDVIL